MIPQLTKLFSGLHTTFLTFIYSPILPGKPVMRTAIAVVILTSSFLFAPSECRKKSKFVTTLIDAKWYQTPIVLEIAEYLAEENINWFWSFVDDISDLETPLSTMGKIMKLHYQFVLISFINLR